MPAYLTLDDFPTPKNLRDSAVLVPIFEDAAGELHVVMVRRSSYGAHGGELAFPGGKHEPTDASLLATALREAEEEVGLAPANVEVLAALPTVDVPSGFRITPFLGKIRRPEVWQWQQREVEEVLEIPLRHLADPTQHVEEVWQLPRWPGPRRVPFYQIAGGYKLWGASYRIISPLIQPLLAGEYVKS
ncbi:NUDIX hydrolase [Hymenobacter volaticus]|uniref:CoA pyrophosphatase n=1 Tax=Hymenobacter volaticus TaxID=2932254 RepID=A0ABY4G391_9BACT|nr:CoA pyrophosphatase [Hymenobacter volaticus]UOQ65340.1 CoA pyrophosphatase [Hymenobacter volaticus]